MKEKIAKVRESNIYYGVNWKTQRKRARQRDNYECKECGIKEEGRQHDVHHVIPFAEFGIERYKEANELSNLKTLCVGCHSYIESRFQKQSFISDEMISEGLIQEQIIE